MEGPKRSLSMARRRRICMGVWGHSPQKIFEKSTLKLVLATSGVWHQLQSSRLSVIQGLKIFSLHDGGDIHPCPPSGYAPESSHSYSSLKTLFAILTLFLTDASVFPIKCVLLTLSYLSYLMSCVSYLFICLSVCLSLFVRLFVPLVIYYLIYFYYLLSYFLTYLWVNWLVLFVLFVKCLGLFTFLNLILNEEVYSPRMQHATIMYFSLIFWFG